MECNGFPTSGWGPARLTICMDPFGNRLVLSGNMVLPAGDPPAIGIVTHMSTIHGAVQQKPGRRNV
ncbi:hypothetical protein CCGE531_16385 [Rhizobium sp. CCGE531]|nr:hypothetical protein CCGE531_16385 [Rhizobium sp. CCGE531]AYG73822.1 hypothetical protein CCGE532_15890 [Rhizobium sp. CCGE532]